jgi:multicomponent Na+:H+ antiporter subunit C
MEAILAIVAGLLFAASFYLLLRRNLLRFIIGLIILSNAANLVIFVMGRLTRENPPVIPAGDHVPPVPYANPLPQALILTAIVISFGLLAFALVLIYRNYRSTDTLDVDRVRSAEPPEPLQARFGEDAVEQRRLPA